MKKFIAVLMAAAMISVPNTNVFSLTDSYILNDEVKNIYAGRKEAAATIANVNFSDISGHWAKEAIVRSGALNLLKGYRVINDSAGQFLPDYYITNLEALAIILRSIGRENEAVDLGAQFQAAASNDIELIDAWYIGYCEIANELELITPDEYSDVISGSFVWANSGATRERVADWIVSALLLVDANTFGTPGAYQAVLNYSDYNLISAERVKSVETLAVNKIMNGDDQGMFNPKGGIKRSEMAQVLKNLDKYYFNIMGYEKKNGTVGTTVDNQYKTTGQGTAWRNILVRTADGSVDSLKFEPLFDAVVYKDGEVVGLANLEEGDEIEYIVNKNNNELLYVQVTKSLTVMEVFGLFYDIKPDEYSINIRDNNGKHYVYSLMEGILTAENDITYVRIDGGKQNITKLPGGSKMKLTLTNGIVTELSYVGDPVVINEIRGIVIENNKDFGYITILDNDGNEVTKYYYEDDLKVKKQHYYDTEDKIGYIDEVFPRFEYNPLDSDISEIEPGDIVFLKMSPDDSGTIISISASTDYIMKYGKIKQIDAQGEYLSFLMEYEDKGTAWYDVAGDVFVSLGGKPVSAGDVKAGDWAKLLVNQAILGPGNIMESVKEIVLEGNEHFITTILKGSLADINTVQNQLVVADSYKLTKTGWNDYNNLSTYSLSGKDIEYYYNDKRISLDYANRYFKRSGASVYIALENNYAGEKVKKVTFRNERDEALPVDTVIYASGAGSFGILGHSSHITADSGTIVRRYGRLVEPHDIMIPDYAYVVINGEKNAAVVDIVENPTTSAVTITARGRIQSVDEGKSFKVQSMSILQGLDWNYTPVQREFSIDSKTVFLNADGVGSIDSFIGYTDESVIDKTFTIVVDGSRAAYVVDAPFCTKSVKGTIYRIEEGIVYLKDAYYYDNDLGRWYLVSNKNSTISIETMPNTIIAKNNKIVTADSYEIGDQIRVMTNDMPAKVEIGTQITGYIVMVEK